MGSSFLPGELIAAFLWAQLEEADLIAQERLKCWQRYHDLLEPLENKGGLRRPAIPEGCEHNTHIYYVLLSTNMDRQALLDDFKQTDIWSVFHYVPLHSSPAGLHYGRVSGNMHTTDTLF